MNVTEYLYFIFHRFYNSNQYSKYTSKVSLAKIEIIVVFSICTKLAMLASKAYVEDSKNKFIKERLPLVRIELGTSSISV